MDLGYDMPKRHWTRGEGSSLWPTPRANEFALQITPNPIHQLSIYTKMYIHPPFMIFLFLLLNFFSSSFGSSKFEILLLLL